MTWLIIGGLAVFVLVLIFGARKWGRSEAKLDTLEADNDLREKARRARQRLDHAARERLRKQFQRNK